MSTYKSSAGTAHHTVAAGAIDVVTLNRGYAHVEITQRDQDASGELWATSDSGPASTSVDPVVKADGTYFIGIASTRTLPSTSPGTTVRITSTTNTAYSVTGID